MDLSFRFPYTFPMLAVYRSACPSCGGPASDERLGRGGVCRRCLPDLPAEPLDPSRLCALLSSPRRLEAYCTALNDVKTFARFFQETTGHNLLPLQETWSRRFFLKQSFAISAPPGMGKTTWSLVLSLFVDGKVLFLVPTRLLGLQVRDRLMDFARTAGLQKNVLLYESRKKVQEAFEAGAFDILVGTVQFFHRRFEELKKHTFGLVVIDDVDAFLKRGRGVDRLVELLGFPEWARKIALRPVMREEDELRLSRLREKIPTRVVMSSATFRPHPRTVRLFDRLLGFSVQQATSTLRNVVDARARRKVSTALQEIPRLVEILGGGGLLFVSELLGREAVDEVVGKLREQGLTVLSYREMDPDELAQRMREEPFHLAVGVAHPHNPLVRGVDMPEILRYALFLEPPVRRIPLALESSPPRLFSLLLLMMPLLEGEEKTRARAYVARLRPLLGTSRTEAHAQLLEEISAFVETFLSSPVFLERLRSRPDVALAVEEGQPVAYIGDATSYIQATGRTSRLLRGRLTRGFSLVFYDNERAMNSLIRRLRLQMMHQDVIFQALEDVDLQAIRKELDESRQAGGKEVRLPATLVVVESPTKARTLASFFGKPQMRRVQDAVVYEIPGEDRYMLLAASLGHVTDLVRDAGFFGVERGGDEGYLPVYDTLKRCLDTGEQVVDAEDVKRKCGGRARDKKDLLEGLRRIAFEVNEVVVATDPDAEGEKIAYDLIQWLRPYQPHLHRAEFHEITPRAFREALASPRDANLNRVKAQLARRILDRWVGFTLSQRLWKAFGQTNLSAGRVQSPVLGWVIERAREAKQKVPEVRWKIGDFAFARRFETREEAERFQHALVSGTYRLDIQSVQEETRSPHPPFTTDRVLVEAHRALGLSAREIMALLQELFEKGYITYHRTDSTHVSTFGRFQVARPWIVEQFGEELFVPRAWGEEGTHEAIRPTRPLPPEDLQEQVSAGLVNFDHPDRAVGLYDLIFRTFMASQMAPARVETGRLVLEAEGIRVEETVPLRILEPGFYRLLGAPPLFRESPVRDVEIRDVPRARPFTQGELIAEMKRRGLGRPSTYAVVVETLLLRKYVVERGGNLWPTRLGEKVYAWLVKHHGDLVSEDLTRRLEETMDRIEKGEASLREVLREFEWLKKLVPG